MADYEPFFVGDLKTGEYIGKKPWLSPDDGWPVLLNAYVDKGVLKRRNGYVDFCTFAEEITGIGAIQFNGYYEVIVCLSGSGPPFYRLYQDGTAVRLESATTPTASSPYGGTKDYYWFAEYNGKLYMCNGINPIVQYTPGINGYQEMVTGGVTIQTCRMLFSYKARLIIVSPKIGGIWYPDYIYYTDVLLDNVAATNFVKANSPTDVPVTGGYIGDVPIIFCQNGNIYYIAYTQNTDAPFAWNKCTGDAGVLARMGCAAFKDNLAVIGHNRLFAYDKYQTREYDLAIRGILDQFHSTNIANSYSALIKDRNFIYTAYTRPAQTEHDRILAFNFDEDNFAEFDIPANCIFSLNGPWLPQVDATRYWTGVAVDNDGDNFIVCNSYPGGSAPEPEGPEGRLYTSSLSGTTWVERRPAGNVSKDWQCVAGNSDGTRYIAAIYDGRLYTSSNSGMTWTERQPAGDADKTWSAVAMNSGATIMVAAVTGGFLYTSADGGINWTVRKPAGDVTSVWSSVACKGAVIIVANHEGRLYISTDSGVNWAETQPAGNTGYAWQCVALDADGSVMLAGIENGRLYMSTNTGTSWAEIQPKGNVNGNWYSLACDSDGSVIIAGEYGRLYTSGNSGVTWIEQQPEGAADKNWAGVACDADGSVAIAISSGGYVWTSGYPLDPTVAWTWTKTKQVATAAYYPVRAQDHVKYNLIAGRNSGGTYLTNVKRIDSGNLDGTSSISTDIRSVQFNPFQKEGLKAKLGWVKFLVTNTDDVSFTVSLYKDHSTTAFKSVRLDCDTKNNPGDKHWETIYTDGEVGEYFQIKIAQTYHTGLTNIAGLEIHGLLLGFKRAGRISKVTEWVAPVSLTIGATATSASIFTGGESDWFKFVVVTGGTYTIETTAGTLLDTYIYLYGPGDKTTLIEEDDDDGVDSASLISRTFVAGTYYVKVKAYDSSDTGTYSIAVRSGT